MILNVYIHFFFFAVLSSFIVIPTGSKLYYIISYTVSSGIWYI